MLARLIPAVALLLLVGGCDLLTYEPSGSNDAQIEPPIAFMGLDFTSAPDTIAVWRNVRLSYHADLDGRPFLKALLTVGDITLSSSEFRQPFDLSTGVLEDGYHEAVLQVFARTNSGSMADRLEAELFVIETRRTLFVQNGPPPTPRNVGTSIRDGRLVVSWQLTPVDGIERLQITKQLQRPDSDHWVTVFAVNVTDLQAREWVDESEVVGNARYELVLFTRGYQSQLVAVAAANTAPFSTLVVTAEGARVSWRQAPLDRSFARYVIERFDGLQPTDLHVFTNRSDTSFVIPGLRFGERSRIRMRLEGPAGGQWYSPELGVWGKGRQAPIEPTTYWNGDFWEMYGSYRLRRYDPETERVATFEMPQQGVFTFSKDETKPRVLVVQNDGRMYLLDAQSLEPVWSGTYAAFGLPAADVNRFRLVDARTAVVALENGRFYRLDLPTGAVTHSIITGRAFAGYDVTPDGRFVLAQAGDFHSVYAFEGERPVVASTAAKTCPPDEFRGGWSAALVLSNDEVAFACDNSIEVRSLPDLIVRRTYSLPMRLSGVSGYRAYGAHGVWLDLRTGATYDPQIEGDGTNVFRILGDYMVDSYGVYIPLSSLL